MKLRYLGPRQSLEVAGYGRHPAGAIKTYPDKFAKELIATSTRQHFEVVAEPKAAPVQVKQKRSASNEETT